MFSYAHHLECTVFTLSEKTRTWRLKIQWNTDLSFMFWALIEQRFNDADLTEISPASLDKAVMPFSHPSLSKIWDNLLCPTVIILRQIVLERQPNWNKADKSRRFEDARCVIPTARLQVLCQKMAFLLQRFSFPLPSLFK